MLVELPRSPHPTAAETSAPAPVSVDLLILGAGWTSTFLIPLLEREGISYAATTRDGRDSTIPFTFDPESEDHAPYAALPRATTVLITFPLRGEGQSRRLTSLYNDTHFDAAERAHPRARWIQLGVTSIWNVVPGWQTEDSPYDTTNPRAIAEDELLSCTEPADGEKSDSEGGGATVLDLSGLWGGTRQPRHWTDRVARTKAELRARGPLHMIHGGDVARAIVAAHRRFAAVRARHWILCDLHVYDWWELVREWAAEGVRREEDGENVEEEESTKWRQLLVWVHELMLEDDVRALPREPSSLQRTLDGRAFWKAAGIWPTQGRVR